MYFCEAAAFEGGAFEDEGNEVGEDLHASHDDAAEGDIVPAMSLSACKG